MTVAPTSHPCSHPTSRHRRARRLGLLAVAGAALVAPSLSAPPAGAAGLLWEVAWRAPVTGTANPPVAGNPGKVAYTVVVPQGYPAACAVPGGNATLSGKAFSIKPALPCNGTYTVSAVASTTGLLGSKAPAISAPVSLANPGPAPGGLGGAADGANRRVTLHWSADPGPDVVGYVVRRNGQPVGNTGKDTTTLVDAVPGAGTFSYDVQTLRWGAGGPGSAPVASPPSSPLPAQVVDDAPPVGIGGGSGGGGTGGGGTGTGTGGAGGGGTGTGTSSTGSGGGGTGTIPGAKSADPKLPGNGKRSGATGSRSTYRSGGTIASRSGGSATETTEPDTFAERLPYQAGSTRKKVELTNPDTTRTVSKTISTPGTSKPGLLVPLAVVLVLVAGSIQIRSFLHRTAPAGIELEPGDPDAFS